MSDQPNPQAFARLILHALEFAEKHPEQTVISLGGDLQVVESVTPVMQLFSTESVLCAEVDDTQEVTVLFDRLIAETGKKVTA